MMEMDYIAHIKTDFTDKFGIPRQSGLIDSLKGTITFTPKYRNPDAVRGLEGFSHIWLIWEFSKAVRDDWSPTVRPPRLGGNTRLGVFATRSPFRPNPIGLSCVKLDSIEYNTPEGPVLHVSGIDILSGTPIFDIKPYIPYADCQPTATDGFTGTISYKRLQVVIDPSLVTIGNPGRRTPKGAHGTIISAQTLESLRDVLAEDPRPHYQKDPSREYGLDFAGYNVRFTVSSDDILTVISIS